MSADKTRMIDNMRKIDKGLGYLDAAHAVQSAIQWRHSQMPKDYDHLKHQRVGIDLSKSDMFGLASLLIDKGVITWADYEEYVRLALNKELHDREQEASDVIGKPVSFR